MKAGIDYIGITTPFYCTDGRGNFLLHKRSDKCRDEHGRWDNGAGKLEFNSTLRENVLREVQEEYGCQGEILEQLPAFSQLREHNGKETHWIAVPFVIKVSPDEAKINDPEKMDEIGWFKLGNLPKPLHSGAEFTLNNPDYKIYFDKYK